MTKVKLTKGELKKQRDSLKQYQRYLPTLQLKKQQLQLEILMQLSLLEQKEHLLSQKIRIAQSINGLFSDFLDLYSLISIDRIETLNKNIAGLDIEVFDKVIFKEIEYDLFLVPLWVDHAVEILKNISTINNEIKIIKKGISLLRHELCITTQRVNLFEKIKIPDAQEAIRLIKIYIGDQMVNAVGRSKIAKSKIELEAALSF